MRRQKQWQKWRKEFIMILGALEAGGTKMVMAVGDEDGNIFEKESIPTGTPAETVPVMIKWFGDRNIEALGIGAFGPVDVDPASATYGHILDTPKLAWVHYDLLGAFTKGLNVPVAIDTDVNAACIGEMRFGCAKGLDSVLYLTVGTGIGAGICVDGRPLHGMLHPEAGHMIIGRHPKDKGECICPYHMSCLEGLASGPAMERRAGRKAEELSDDDIAWEIESFYLSEGILNMLLTVSPQRIILGGGVMHREKLFPMIREKVAEMLNGYIRTPELADIESYIVPSSLHDEQGVLGALWLAARR